MEPSAWGGVELSQSIAARGVATITTALAGGGRGYQLTARLRFSTVVGPLEVEHRGMLGGGGGGLGAR